jgi:hypothetical protein
VTEKDRVATRGSAYLSDFVISHLQTYQLKKISSEIVRISVFRIIKEWENSPLFLGFVLTKYKPNGKTPVNISFTGVYK